MPTEPIVAPVAPEVPPVQPPAPEPTPPVTAEHMIPKSRFDEVNSARDKAEKELKKLQDAEVKRQEAQMTKEQLAEKQLADEKAKAEQAVADAAKKVAEADEKLLKAAFLLKAKDLGFEHPADAFALADKTVKRNDDGEYDEASIEAALKPLIGRLPVKAQGDGKGTPKLPPAPASKTKQKEGRAFGRTF